MSKAAAVPPSPQEVSRKLSIHSPPKHFSKKHGSTAQSVSGTESDSDSILTPDIPPLSAGTVFVSTLSQPPLDSIAERLAGSGEETDDDDEEADDADDGKPKPRRSNDDTVIKSSYLWKKGQRRKTWKKRWFVLHSAYLAYYKSSAEYQLLRMVDLSEVHTCTVVTLKRHDNTFGIVSPTRTFYLQAKTQPEVHAWVKAINEAKENVQQTSTGGTSSSAPILIPTSTRAPVLSASSSSHSPQGYGVTSSESDDGLPSGPRSHHMANASSTPPTAHAKEGAKPLLSGYLMKCGSKRRAWHHRWFVLSGEKLTYSRSHMDTKPHREIPLSLIIDALDFEAPGHRNIPIPSPPHFHSQTGTSADRTRSTTFKIVTTKRALVLCAPSDEEEIKWLSAIRALIARREAGVVPGDIVKTTGLEGAKNRAKRLSSSTAFANPVVAISGSVAAGEGPTAERVS